MLDILIVVTYLLLLMSIGFYNRSRFQNFTSFASVTNNGSSSFLIIATIFASSIGGGTSFGISERVFSEDISYGVALMAAAIIDVLIAIFIIPKFVQKHYGAKSVGDIMFVYYGNVGRYLSGVAAIVFSIGILAAQISVSGYIFNYMLEVDYIFAVIISYSMVIVYTTIGGLRSILFTNQIQFIAIAISIPLISIFGLLDIGLMEFINAVPINKIDIFSTKDKIQTTIYIILGFAVMNMFPNFIQRILIQKDYKKTQKAILLKTSIYIIFLVFITLNGLIAFVKFPDIDSKFVLSVLIENTIPVGIKGLVIAGLLSAVMSTADSDLNISSVTLVKDIITPLFHITNQQKMLKIARIVNIFIGGFSIIIALNFSNIVDLVIFVSGFWVSVIIVPMIFGIFNKIISVIQMIISSAVGFSMFVFWEIALSDVTTLKPVFIGFIVNLMMFSIFLTTNKAQVIKIS